MKKNKMMRLASALLVMTLMTTSIISGTFAKYVTQASATDAARVAKWGVDITTYGSLFSETYKHKTEDSITVASYNYDYNGLDGNGEAVKDSLVAPGTENVGGLTFTIDGMPEVAVDVDFDITVEDIFLEKGTYHDYTTGTSTVVQGGEVTTTGDTVDSKDVFTTSDTYYPVKFTLTQLKDNANEATKVVTDGTLDDVKKYLANNVLDSTRTEADEYCFEPNTDLGTKFGTFNLTWKWDFEGTGDDAQKLLIDQQDTLLGNLAVNSALEAKAGLSGSDVTLTTLTHDDFSTNVGLTLKITVTQID